MIDAFVGGFAKLGAAATDGTVEHQHLPEPSYSHPFSSPPKVEEKTKKDLALWANMSKLHSRGKGGFARTVQSSIKGIIVAFSGLLLLLFAVSSLGGSRTTLTTDTTTSEREITTSSHIDDQSSHRPQVKPIRLSCPENPSTPAICQRFVDSSTSSWQSAHSHTTTQTSSSCPDYFRWIHEDLRHWMSTGITREMVESAKQHATFRLVVLDGRVYVEEYFGRHMTRNVFTLWGILQLMNRYPGRIPDLDLMFNCVDQPAIRSADYIAGPPPPLFHYCKNQETMDILFPDWSFWGWPDTHIKPWATLTKEMKESNEKMKWDDRIPYAFWKGNPRMGAHRTDLMKCNASEGRDWNARLYTQDWQDASKQVFQQSNLANQCQHRYKIYVEGYAWSVSQKYIMACDSPTLLITTHFDEFFSRGLIPGQHFWPIPEDDKCRSIKFAVDWGNNHQKEAQEIGNAGSGFVHEQVKMDYVYDYMLHVLQEYAKLLRYKPSVPEKATEYCLESMVCDAPQDVKRYLLESMEKQSHDAEPCQMPPPFRADELNQILKKKANYIKEIETLKQKAMDEQRINF